MKTTDRVLEAIEDYISVHGYAPSYREIGEMVGLSSSASVATHMMKLLDRGDIETDLELDGLSPRAYRLRRDDERV